MSSVDGAVWSSSSGPIAARLVVEDIEKAVAGPTTEVDLLRVVERHPGITVAAAAERLRVAPNTVSTRVTHLVEAGLLDRRPGVADRRQATLYLTAETEARFAAWAGHRSAMLNDLVTRLSPEERAAVTAALPALRHLRRLLDERAGGRPGEVRPAPRFEVPLTRICRTVGRALPRVDGDPGRRVRPRPHDHGQ